MGDERLEDVIADRGFLDVTCVGEVCDVIRVGAEPTPTPVPLPLEFVFLHFRILVEKMG